MASASQDFEIPNIPKNLKIDRFIITSYNFGVSTSLIQRVLIERDYNLSLEKIRSVLLENEINDTGVNCSRKSYVWRRYLSYIIGKFDPLSLQEFKDKALEEATRYFDINEEILTNYWNDLCEFHVKAPLGSSGHKDFGIRFRPWIFSAFTHFGYNPHSLVDYLKKTGFDISINHLVRLFNEEAKNTGNRELMFIMSIKFPPYHPLAKNFWKASYELFGNGGIPTIMEISEIVGGYRIKADDIRNTIPLMTVETPPPVTYVF